MTGLMVPSGPPQVKKTEFFFAFDFTVSRRIVDALTARCLVLSDIFMFEEHDEPIRSILAYYLSRGGERLTPRDSETRSFLTDIPIIGSVGDAVADRTVHLVRTGAILVRGVADAAQAIVHRDIVRFSLFVLFFGEMLAKQRAGTLPFAGKDLAHRLLAAVPELPAAPPPMLNGPFADEPAAQRAVVEAGNALVAAGLVDSVFGNLSCRIGDTLLISRTGVPLDRLDGGVVACRLDGPVAPRGASSEYPSHRRIVTGNRYRAVLHGHPRWTVIWSLASEDPRLFGLPVVEGAPGEELARVLPDAVAAHGAAIVRGHGLFAAGIDDFRAPFETMDRVEHCAFADYLTEMS